MSLNTRQARKQGRELSERAGAAERRVAGLEGEVEELALQAGQASEEAGAAQGELARLREVEQHVQRDIFGATERANASLIPRYCRLRASLHTAEEPWGRLAPLTGRLNGYAPTPTSLILPLSTRRCVSPTTS